MGIKNTYGNVLSAIKKYRYALLVLTIGLLLMMIPDFNHNSAEQNQVVAEEPVSEPSLETRLSQILSNVEGAGPVQVMLTVSAGEEVVYQTDNNSSYHADMNTVNASTVMITNADRTQTGLIRQKIPEVYQGAIIVCQGADDPRVRLEIVEAVSRITGIGTNQISVLKMKQ